MSDTIPSLSIAQITVINTAKSPRPRSSSGQAQLTVSPSLIACL